MTSESPQATTWWGLVARGTRQVTRGLKPSIPHPGLRRRERDKAGAPPVALDGHPTLPVWWSLYRTPKAGSAEPLVSVRVERSVQRAGDPRFPHSLTLVLTWLLPHIVYKTLMIKLVDVSNASLGSVSRSGKWLRPEVGVVGTSTCESEAQVTTWRFGWPESGSLLGVWALGLWNLMRPEDSARVELIIWWCGEKSTHCSYIPFLLF